MEKKNDNELVTKGFLREELKNHKQDICFELRNEMDIKFGAFYDSLKDWKDEILNGDDKLMRRFDSFEKENASLHLNYGYIKSDVEDLQKRVVVLEKAV